MEILFGLIIFNKLKRNLILEEINCKNINFGILMDLIINRKKLLEWNSNKRNS